MVDVFPDVPPLFIDLIYCLVIQHCWTSVAILKFHYWLLVLQMLYAGAVIVVTGKMSNLNELLVNY